MEISWIRRSRLFRWSYSWVGLLAGRLDKRPRHGTQTTIYSLTLNNHDNVSGIDDGDTLSGRCHASSVRPVNDFWPLAQKKPPTLIVSMSDVAGGTTEDLATGVSVFGSGLAFLQT